MNINKDMQNEYMFFFLDRGIFSVNIGKYKHLSFMSSYRERLRHNTISAVFSDISILIFDENERRNMCNTIEALYKLDLLNGM